MATEVRLPQWGEMTSATVVKWLKREGEQVAQGEPLLEVETEKINSQMEAPASGILARILVPEGEVAQVGAVLAVLAAPGEEAAVSQGPMVTGGAAVAPSPAAPTVAAVPQQRVQIEPGARRLARQLGVALHTVQGTGPHGRITVEDVRKAAQAVAVHPAPAAPAPAPLTGMRKTIAERMLRSSRETAALTLATEVDVTALAELREELRSQGIRPLHVIVMAVAGALKEHPAMNAHIEGDQVRRMEEVNIGVAVALDEGLIVPVVRSADQKSLYAIAQEAQALADRARQGTLKVEDVTGGTFTVTNLGALDVDVFTPILNQPEVGILGVGRIAERPAIHQGVITKRAMMWLSLTFDHRAVDGAPAAAFLRSVKARLEELSWLVPRVHP